MRKGEISFRLQSKVQIVSVLALLLASVTAAAAGPSVFPTGVTRYDPSKAYNCDILFSAPDNKTHLIDMNGHEVHEWDRIGFPAKMLNPALIGGVKGEIGQQLKLVPAGSSAGAIGLVPGQKGRFRDLTFGYVDWNGHILWQWGTQAPGGAALQHHDWELLPTGNTLLLANQVKHLKGFGNRLMLDPVIYEINKSGKIVWSWKASQHLAGLGFTGERLRQLERQAHADYFHMNVAHELGPNRWAASGDKRFAPKNIIVSSRNANFVAIISRKTGQIVWRLGPKFHYPARPYGMHGAREVPFPFDHFSGQHDAHMIPKGLPGAGNILVFDDEGEGGYPPDPLPMYWGSRVLEISPITRQVVWQYTGSKATFFSSFLSSAQRLPNGNTLIDEGINGRFFQVTPKGEIVWEYISPFEGKGPLKGSAAPIRWVYRIQAVPYSWIPKGVPHSEDPVKPPQLANFHIPASMGARNGRSAPAK